MGGVLKNGMECLLVIIVNGMSKGGFSSAAYLVVGRKEGLENVLHLPEAS